MSTTLEHHTHGGLRLRTGTGGTRPNPQAWKSLVGNKPVSARFSLLPNTKPKVGAMGTSLVVQIVLAAFFIILPVMFPQRLIPHAMYMVTAIELPPAYVAAPPPPPPAPKPPAPKPKPKAEPPPPPPPVEKPVVRPNVPKMFTPVIEPPKPKPRQVNEADLPKVNETFKPLKMELAENNQPARPRDPVKTGLMTGGSSAPATINKPLPLDKVQTGGFGDPDGVAATGNSNKRTNINSFGSPALPAGPGYGNGTGGANGARGTVASTGFGNGVAIPPPATKRGGNVQSTGFADQNQQVIEAPKKKANEDAAAVEPVVILEKPKPVYSQEALKLNLEGEVLLDVIFMASGNEVHVNRVVKGLGHGLDEAAVRAAQQIKYKPAMSNGHPVDFPAVAHIVFQIAY
jgi:TonB family protein